MTDDDRKCNMTIFRILHIHVILNTLTTKVFYHLAHLALIALQPFYEKKSSRPIKNIALRNYRKYRH